MYQEVELKREEYEEILDISKDELIKGRQNLE